MLTRIGKFFTGSGQRKASASDLKFLHYKRRNPFSNFKWRSGTSRNSSEAGFTLVEMLVVITIIGLIMGLIGPRVLNYLSESKVKTAKIQLQSFSSALDLFYLDAGRFPSTAEGLAALVQRTPGVAAWNGPYLKGGNVPNDPWNHPYVYRSPGDRGPYDIISYGSDGQEGGSGLATDISMENLTSAKNE